jgi:hypothetical protein
MRVMDQAARLRSQLLALATAVIAACLTAGSCDYPSANIVWAPNGQRALVTVGLAQMNTMLIDSSGNDLGRILTSSELFLTWMPDSLHLLVSRQALPQSWSDYAHLVGPQRANAISRAADTLAGYVRSYHGDWNNFGKYAPVAALWKAWRSGGITDAQVHYYLAQTQPRVLAPVVNAAKAEIKEQMRVKGVAQSSSKLLFGGTDLLTPPVSELVILDASTSTTVSRRVLIRMPYGIGAALPSPSGRVIALYVDEPGKDNTLLILIRTEANVRAVSVAADALPVAWSPDGQDLAYVQAANVDRGLVQLNIPDIFVMSRRRVCTLGGDVLNPLGGRQDLTEAQLADYGFVGPWLPDGRIIMASAIMPANPNAPSFALFSVRAQATPIVEPILTPALWSKLIDDKTPIVVSADGKLAALVTKHGAVTVVFLETGEVRPLQGDIPGVDDNETIPAWRTDGELTYVVGPGDPAGSPNRRELVIDDLRGNKRAISKTWRDANFLATPAPPSPSASVTPPH